ncbi:MAG TPA: hypothetical protein DCY14_06320 [Anaerolineae bacterium]|nr:hypothetical protein [Anaerolineae bacterium]HRJ58258.1 DinB family protein [Anaerolineales bacterium]
MDTINVIQELDKVRTVTYQRLAGLTQIQLDARPGQEEAWSLGEIFMHIAIDEIYLREMISRPLREGILPPVGITFLPPPPPYGVDKQTIRFWLERSRSQTLVYIQDWPLQWDSDLRHAGNLEPMNALEWLLGYAGHEASHHRQIDDLVKRFANQ